MNNVEHGPWEDFAQAAPQPAERGPWDDFAQQTPTHIANGILDAFTAGVENSATGIAYRGKLPDIQIDPEHATRLEKLASGVGQLAADLPLMMGAGAVGGATGGPVGAGVLGFGVPATIREAYVQAYTKGEIRDVADFLGRAQIIVREGGKEGLIGALTTVTGGAAKGLSMARGLGGASTAALTLGTEAGTLTLAPAALEGRLPDFEDFVNGAIMVGGIKAAHAVAPKVMNVFAKTGRSPDQVAFDAMNDPQITDDLGVPEKVTPQMEAWRETSKSIIPNEKISNSSDLIGMVKDTLGEDHFASVIMDRMASRIKDFKVEVLSDTEWKYQNRNSNRDAETDLNKQTIRFREGIKTESAVHEVVHEGTAAELEANPDFKSDVRAIMDRVTGAIEKGEVQNVTKPELRRLATRAMKSEAEFVAYGLTSPEVMNVLRGIRGDSGYPTVFTKFVSTLANAFGFGPREYTALHDLIRVVDKGVEQSPKYEGGKIKDYIKNAGKTESAKPTVSETVPPAEAPNVGEQSAPIAPPAEHVAGELTGKVEVAPPEREIPRAYEMEAMDEKVREAIRPAASVEKPSEPLSEQEKPTGPTLPSDIALKDVYTQDEVKAILEARAAQYEEQTQKQRRGVVTWQQTETEAADYLRTLLGADAAAPREPGTPAGAAELKARADMMDAAIDETRLMAEKIRNAGEVSTDDFVEFIGKFDMLNMIQAECRGAVAEAGRALNILRNKRVSAERAKLIADLFEKYKDDPKTLAEMVLALDSPEQVAKLAREMRQATTWEKVVEGYRASLISGPFSQIQNIAGNLFFMPSRVLVDATAAQIGKMRGDAERVHTSEPLARVIGNIHGAVDGAKVAKDIFFNGVKPAENEISRNANEGVAGKIIGIPFRGLAIGDALVRTMAERGEAYALAARQAVGEGYDPASREFRDRYIDIATNGLTDAQQAAVKAAGVRGTFNAPLRKGWQRDTQNLIRSAKMEWAIPFIQTPMNVATEVLRLTPAGPLTEAWAEDFRAGGAARDKALGELAVGVGMGVMTFAAASAGIITGGGDPDPSKRAAQLKTGWQPYSMKVGDTYYSFARLAPIGTVIGLYADMHQLWEHMGEGERDKMPKILAMAFANAITNQTFVQGAVRLLDMIGKPDENAGKFFEGLAASMVPGVVSQMNQIIDPYQREVDGMFDAIKARIPGVSQTLPKKIDMFGDPVEARRRALGILPINVSKEHADLAASEMVRLEIGVEKAPKYIQLSSGHDTKLGRVELSPPQREKFAEITGKQAHAVLAELVADPGWSSIPDIEQRNIIQKTYKDAREYAKAMVLPEDQLAREYQRIQAGLEKDLAQK